MSTMSTKQSLFVLSHGAQEEGGSAIDAGYDLDALKRYAEELHAETVREYADFRAADERDGEPDLDIWNIHDALTWRHTDPETLKAREIAIPRADRHVESWYADCGNYDYYSIRRFEVAPRSVRSDKLFKALKESRQALEEAEAANRFEWQNFVRLQYALRHSYNLRDVEYLECVFRLGSVVLPGKTMGDVISLVERGWLKTEDHKHYDVTAAGIAVLVEWECVTP